MHQQTTKKNELVYAFMIKISTSSQRHGKRNIVSYTLSRSFSLAVIVVFRKELPSYISSMKYFTGDFSKGKLSDTKKQIHKSKKEMSMSASFTKNQVAYIAFFRFLSSVVNFQNFIDFTGCIASERDTTIITMLGQSSKCMVRGTDKICSKSGFVLPTFLSSSTTSFIFILKKKKKRVCFFLLFVWYYSPYAVSI